jgi:hypothetical protein
VAAAAFALAGVIVGVLITSGYNFWAVRRQELVRGSVAARALDDEMHWLSNKLSEAVSGRRAVHLDAASAVAIWREQREALVLWITAQTSGELGGALRACERWQEELGDDAHSELQPHEIEEARVALAKLDEARMLLKSLAAYLWSEHEVFILTTLFRMTRRAVRRARGEDTGWQPPEIGASEQA